MNKLQKLLVILYKLSKWNMNLSVLSIIFCLTWSVWDSLLLTNSMDKIAKILIFPGYEKIISFTIIYFSIWVIIYIPGRILELAKFLAEDRI